MALRRVDTALAEVLNRRRRVDAQLRPTRIEGRNGDGTVNQRRLDGECVARGPICSLPSGQVIDAPCAPPAKYAGAAGIAMARGSRTAPAMWLESISPDFFAPGGTYTVTFSGRGFRASSRFDFLVPGTEDVNEDITELERRYVSSTEFEMDIAVAADATVYTASTGSVAFDNPGTPL